MLTDFNFPWERLHQIAAELAVNGMDRNVLETIINYIQTQRPNQDELIKWLDAFTRDGYLAARTKQTWNYHRQAKDTVEVLLKYTPALSDRMTTLALALAQVTRLLTYYRENKSNAYSIVSDSSRTLLREFNSRDRPPSIPKRPRSKKRKKPQADIPQVSDEDDISDAAKDFMSWFKSQSEDKDDE